MKIDDLEREIIKGLEEYRDLTIDALKEVSKSVAKDVKYEIQKNAPEGNTKTYKKSWVIKTEENSHSVKITVHSKNRYQLAHLLEKGHAKRGGGRTKAIPHIRPSEEKGVNEFERKLKEKIGG